MSNLVNEHAVEYWESLGFGFQGCLCAAIERMEHPTTQAMEMAHWYIDRALMNPTTFQSYAQLGCLHQCLSFLSEFNYTKAKAKMDSFINLGTGQ